MEVQYDVSCYSLDRVSPRVFASRHGHAASTPVMHMPTRSNCCSASPPSGMGCRLQPSSWSSWMRLWSLRSWNTLKTVRGNSSRTRNARLAAVKAFAHFIEYRVPSAVEQVRCIMAIPFKKTDEALVDYLNRQELQALLDAPDPTTRSGTRDRAMLHLCFAAGLRVSELVGLRLDQVQTHPEASIHVRGKGRRERVLPLWKETLKALRAWLAVRGQTPLPNCFSAPRAARLLDPASNTSWPSTSKRRRPPARRSPPSVYHPTCCATPVRCIRFRQPTTSARSPCGWATQA